MFFGSHSLCFNFIIYVDRQACDGGIYQLMHKKIQEWEDVKVSKSDFLHLFSFCGHLRCFTDKQRNKKGGVFFPSYETAFVKAKETRPWRPSCEKHETTGLKGCSPKPTLYKTKTKREKEDMKEQLYAGEDQNNAHGMAIYIERCNTI